ncbi:MAG: GNAT family N-acetyltransferase [Oscillospiraceae bacterium]|jgi:predicted acetyltransferase|nr:GNAT family N-acetyltransferase [Oscillospiraceae bacterium]
MKFVFPRAEYEDGATAYIREFHDHASQVNGAGGLERYLRDHTYSEWLAKVRADADIANVPPGKVPSLTYFYVRESDDKIIGMINIRLALNDFLRTEGGHIGYSIRPTERRRGYGTQMLREALEFCAPIGLREVILTCDKSNPASSGVIKNCGGVLDAEFFSEAYNKVIQRYKIIR